MTKYIKRVHLEEVTLLRAVAECYNFRQRSHKKESNSKLYSKAKTKLYGLENHGQKIDHEWRYFDGETNCPTFSQCEQHFLSNLFCGDLRKKEMIYSAQQGDFKVYRVDTNI